MQSTIPNEQKMKPTKMTTLLIRNSISRSPLRHGFLLIALAWFALSPTARAVSPAPDGGYANDNTAEGDGALFFLTTGTANTANGGFALYGNTTGSDNTATGFNALFSNQTGSFNTATGLNALYKNTGSNNTATGTGALESNTTGASNTATGVDALLSNTTGHNNTANGLNALFSNTIGTNNTANGLNALHNNKNGGNNTANGAGALFFTTSGIGNTASGFNALEKNTIGGGNTANGLQALQSNTTGNDNTANGLNALESNTIGSNNIALGVFAGDSLTTGSNNIDIGNQGLAAEGNTIRIGTEGTQTNTFIAGISGVTVAGGVGVIIDTNGHLGTVVSSERFKEAIKPMDKASEAILSLRPVTFRYKHELDPNGIPQFGLVAEQVEKVSPDLVARDEQGKVYTVRYEAVNAMLLNEFLKEHHTVQELKSIVAKQEATAAQQQKEIETLTAGLQKVSAQVELKQPSSQMVVNSP
jgi:hypothetical protein